MSRLCLNVLLLSSVGYVLALDPAYPKSYPFENEAFVPAEVPPSTPDFSFAETDPGGYTWYGIWQMTKVGGSLTDDMIPYVPHYTGYTSHLLVTIYGAPPVLPVANWNCTAKDYRFTEADFTGEVDGNRICAVGQCCTSLMGLEKYGDDQMTWHTWATDRSAAGLCGPIEIEDLYCIVVGGHHHCNCWSYVVSPTDRLVTFPCYDNAILYWLTCPVFKSVYVFQYVKGAQEPIAYQDAMSVEEQMAADGSFMYPDRVCSPHSYYRPASAPTDTSSTVASDTDNSSPALLKSVMSVVLSALFMFR